MITINDWLQIKPKRVRFIELDVCNNSRVEDEIVRDETTEQECVEIINKYAERNIYLVVFADTLTCNLKIETYNKRYAVGVFYV